MKHVHALLVVVLAAGATAACASAEPPPVGTAALAAAIPDPKDALVSGAKAVDAGSFNMTLDQNSTKFTFRYDGAAKAAEIAVSGKVEGISISMGYLVIAPNVWFKADLGATANKAFGITKNKYMLIDQSKVPGRTGLPVDESGNPNLALTPLLESATGVTKTDATHYAGKFDVGAANSPVEPASDVERRIGDRVKAVPFTATLDEQGRITELRVDGTGIDPAVTAVAGFSGFGAIKPITKPVGAFPAPPAVYKIFGA